MANNWLKFWKEKNAFDDSMAINYSYFLKKVQKYVQPAFDSAVLDIGSGPGNLEDAWFAKVKEIHGIDISERYNNIARQKHQAHPNVFFYDLAEKDYTNLSMLNNKKFNIIIVMSVLQYYQNKHEIIQLLENLKPHAAPGSILLLCDLMVESSFGKEIMQILSDAIRERKFFSILSLLFRLRFSNYYKVKKETGFLILKQNDWLEIINHLQLNGKFTDEPLTLQKNRKNIIVQF